MKKLFPLLVLGLCWQAMADDIPIEIQGSIVATTCALDSANQNLTVRLDQAASKDFKEVGDTGAWKNFTLTLSKCPPSVVLATATFHGQADSAHPTKFANTGTAKGLALELMDPQDQILLSPDASFSVSVNQSNHTADFPLSARYYTTATPVSGGTFSSVVQVTFIYQ